MVARRRGSSVTGTRWQDELSHSLRLRRLASIDSDALEQRLCSCGGKRRLCKRDQAVAACSDSDAGRAAT